ncbi:hypothetical protein CRM22_008501 [Opisthorchis felineus]|uniref:Ig-like domain-containing protein n=1 Tax=Opisthorchis felineus TaxID=147828 RepID=A0A4S2LBM3_OPIFE|nr:hypothetical protein CRM22_008501 [Opisthorchis felineus]
MHFNHFSWSRILVYIFLYSRTQLKQKDAEDRGRNNNFSTSTNRTPYIDSSSDENMMAYWVEDIETWNSTIFRKSCQRNSSHGGFPLRYCSGLNATGMKKFLQDIQGTHSSGFSRFVQGYSNRGTNSKFTYSSAPSRYETGNPHESVSGGNSERYSTSENVNRNGLSTAMSGIQGTDPVEDDDFSFSRSATTRRFTTPPPGRSSHPTRRSSSIIPISSQSESEDWTFFEALPYGFEQFTSSSMHGLVDLSEWNVEDLPPAVQLSKLIVYDANRPLTLPCWMPLERDPIEFHQTTERRFRRTWYVGHGEASQLTLAKRHGYETDQVSGTLSLFSLDGSRYEHDTFTCMISSEDEQMIGRSQHTVSFSQTHHVVVDEQHLPNLRMKPSIPPRHKGIEVEVELVTHIPESDVPACTLYDAEHTSLTCREAFWSNTKYPYLNNEGYRLFYNPRLQYQVKGQLLEWVTETAQEFCKVYGCIVENVTMFRKLKPFEPESPSLAESPDSVDTKEGEEPDNDEWDDLEMPDEAHTGSDEGLQWPTSEPSSDMTRPDEGVWTGASTDATGSSDDRLAEYRRRWKTFLQEEYPNFAKWRDAPMDARFICESYNPKYPAEDEAYKNLTRITYVCNLLTGIKMTYLILSEVKKNKIHW